MKLEFMKGNIHWEKKSRIKQRDVRFLPAIAWRQKGLGMEGGVRTPS